MDNTQVRNSLDHTDTPGQSTDKKPYESPALYVYGALDDLTEYAGAGGYDGIVGNTIAP